MVVPLPPKVGLQPSSRKGKQIGVRLQGVSEQGEKGGYLRVQSVHRARRA